MTMMRNLKTTASARAKGLRFFHSSETMLKTLLDGQQGGALYELARANLNNQDPRLFSVNLQNPFQNQSLNLKVNNLGNTLSALSYYLNKNKETLEQYSIFNMSIPKTHSLVLHWDRERLMVRLYVTDLEKMHESHFYCNWTSSPFLWHSHGYNFISLPLLAEGLTQQRALLLPEGEKALTPEQSVQALTYRSPILNPHLLPSQLISYNGKTKLTKHPIENKRPGEAYFMHTTSEIHRVGFAPFWRTPFDYFPNIVSKNRMSAVLFFEFRNFTAEDYLNAGYTPNAANNELRKRERAYVTLPPEGQEQQYKKAITSVVSAPCMFKLPSPKEVKAEVEQLVADFKR